MTIDLADFERRVASLAGDVATTEEAFAAGRDAAVNGSNTTNSGVRFFRSAELSDAWSRGHDAGKAS